MNNVYCCYPGGRYKALTLSYDDGRESDRRLVALLNEYGVKGTFHLNGALLGTWDRIPPGDVAALYEGHEVACHTLTHPTIARCPLPQVMGEVLGDRRVLEGLTGAPVRGLSYPNGSYSADIIAALPALGIRYARVVEETGGFSLPADPYRWRATCHHNHRLAELGAQFLSLNRPQRLYLMYVWGHSYEFDDRDNWEVIEAFCRQMGGRADIWYCTNIQLMDCLDDYAALQFAADNRFVRNPGARDCWIQVNNAPPVCVPGGRTITL